MVKAEGITKNYGPHRAVDNLSFEFEKGRVYGLLGVNGAGKSTTMNIITGYLAPSAGSVSVGGDSMLKKPDKAKAHIGYLPELPPLYVDMTVREYLKFSAQLKKVRKKDMKAELERVMKLTGVDEVSGRLIRNLSKGYKQRVGLAQALLGDPEVIILDEPTVGLDPRQIIEIRTLIRRLGQDHVVVLSSHILSEVQAVCDEILIISSGHLVASGTPESLEGMAGGSKDLMMLIKGKKDSFLSLIKDIPSAGSSDIKEEEGGMLRIRLSFSGNDIREELFYALAAKKMPILEMSMRHASLEDVFLELVEKEPEAHDASGESGASEESGSDTESAPEVDDTEGAASGDDGYGKDLTDKEADK